MFWLCHVNVLFSLDESLDKRVNYLDLAQLKFCGKRAKVAPVLYIMTSGYSNFRKLPNLTFKVNSFDDFYKSTHFY